MKTPSSHSEWWTLHIPSRFWAAFAHTPLHPGLGELEIDEFTAHAVQMGRTVALRWLIEFVGIRDPKGNDIRIDDLGGRLFDKSSEEGREMDNLWLAASKAVAHATNGSNHPELTVDRQVVSLHVIKTFVNSQIYEPYGMDLNTILNTKCTQSDSANSLLRHVSCGARPASVVPLIGEAR